MGVQTGAIIVYGHGFDKATAEAVFAVAELHGTGTTGSFKTKFEIREDGSHRATEKAKDLQRYKQEKQKIIAYKKGGVTFDTDEMPTNYFTIDVGEHGGKMYVEIGGGKYNHGNEPPIRELAKEVFSKTNAFFGAEHADEDETPFECFFEWASGDYSRLKEWAGHHNYFMFEPSLLEGKDFSKIQKDIKTEDIGGGKFFEAAPVGGHKDGGNLRKAREKIAEAFIG